MTMNGRWVAFMRQEFTTRIEDYFDPKLNPDLNTSRIKSNYYARDKYGFPVRQQFRDKNDIYGWRLINNEIINVNVDPGLNDGAVIIKKAIDVIRSKYRSKLASSAAMRQAIETLTQRYGLE